MPALELNHRFADVVAGMPADHIAVVIMTPGAYVSLKGQYGPDAAAAAAEHARLLRSDKVWPVLVRRNDDGTVTVYRNDREVGRARPTPDNRPAAVLP